MNNKAKRIALAGVGSAVALLMIALGYYIKNMSLSFNVLASVGIMLPLTQRYYREAILSYIAVCGLGFLWVNISVVPFIMVGGAYTIFTVFWQEKKLNKWLGYGIKIAYSLLVFFICYKVTSLLTLDLNRLTFLQGVSTAWIYVIFNLIFSICFIAYDFVLIFAYKYLCNLVSKVYKKRG